MYTRAKILLMYLQFNTNFTLFLYYRFIYFNIFGNVLFTPFIILVGFILMSFIPPNEAAMLSLNNSVFNNDVKANTNFIIQYPYVIPYVILHVSYIIVLFIYFW
eukprot:128360_1